MVETIGKVLIYLNHNTGLPASPAVVEVGPTRIGRHRSIHVHTFSDVNADLAIQYSNDGINFATESILIMGAHTVIGDIHSSRVKGEWVKLLFANTTGVPGVTFSSLTYAVPINPKS